MSNINYNFANYPPNEAIKHIHEVAWSIKMQHEAKMTAEHAQASEGFVSQNEAPYVE